MNLDNNGICYFFLYDKNDLPGVHKKITGTLNSAEKLNLKTRIFNQSIASKNFRFKNLLFEIINCKERHLIIRSIFFLNFIIFPFIIIARFQGKYIYFDVPTPFAAVPSEIISDNNISLFNKLLYFAGLYVSGPWSLWPANRIFQYSDENTFFSFCNKNRTFNLGNGINLNEITPRKSIPDWPSNNLELLGVAFVSKAHGFDKIINSIFYWNSNNNKQNILFRIVGDGPEKNNLIKLVKHLKLENQIFFYPNLSIDELSCFYDNAHLAIGTLAIHRKKLITHSELKAREYCAIGIPFISSGIDYDFNNCDFRITIPADENLTPIINIFENISNHLYNLNIKSIRHYAENNLTFDIKIKKMLILD
jgi:hypothetical protein